MPVAAGARGVDHLHRCAIEADGLGDRGAERVQPLRMRPHREDAVHEAGERGRRRERAVHLVGALVDRAHRSRSVRRRHGNRLRARPALSHRKALPPVAEELLGQRPLVECAGRIPPRARRHPRGGPNRQVFVLRRHREEAAVAHQPGAFEVGLDTIVERGQGGMVVGRADNPGMQQVRGAGIVDEAQRAGDHLAQMKRLDGRRPRRRSAGIRKGWRFLVDWKGERRVFHQLAEADGSIGLARAYQAVLNVQGFGIHAKALRGARNQLAAGGGGGGAHGAARLLHRVAARGIAFVGRHAGARGHHHDAVEGHPELPGRDQRHGRRDALPYLDLAGAYLDAAVGSDGDPVLDAGVGRETRVGAHRDSPAASFRTARSTLGWAPQRHRWGASAARIAASSGCGSLRSNPVIATTSPGVQ